MSSNQVVIDGRKVTASSFPISLDVEEIEALAADESVRARATSMREELGSPEHVLLGVDRLDYTKGIRHRLKAWSELLQDGEVTTQDAVFVQVATPSRERVDAYQALRDEIELEVGHINGEHGTIGSSPSPASWSLIRTSVAAPCWRRSPVSSRSRHRPHSP